MDGVQNITHLVVTFNLFNGLSVENEISFRLSSKD